MAAAAVAPPAALFMTSAADSMCSAAALLALLQEPDITLKVEALRQLWQNIDFCWMDMTKDDITLVEELYEDDGFPKAKLAAAVASKFYYHLEQYEDAVEFALGSGEFFNVDTQSEYVDTIVAKCIDTYIKKQQKAYVASVSAKRSGIEDTKDMDTGGDEIDSDERLSSVVEKMFDRCHSDGQYTQALGIALESRRLDQVERAILESNDVPGLLAFCFDFCRVHIPNRGFRQTVLRILARLYRTHCATPDFVNVCQCLQFLGDSTGVADVLLKLLKQGENEALVSYQVAFRIDENQNQQFMREIINALPATATISDAATEALSGSTAAPAVGSDTDVDAAESTATTIDDASKQAEPAATSAAEMSSELKQRLERLIGILDGSMTIKLHLEFLCVHNKTDLLILQQIKDAIGARQSVLHNATVVAHAYMNCGTTQHTFLRDNEEWLRKATHWARFTAIAGLGVVHKGHLSESLQILKPYMPAAAGQAAAQPFCEGGALFALGLIHANKGWTDGGKMVNFLKEKLASTRDPTVLHGACLGLGCTAMASGSKEIATALKNALHNFDDAVAGEAAAYGLGLLNVGCGQAAAMEIEQMLSYAHETQHEKIIRGLSLGVALIMYGQEEVADALIEQMLRDKDHIIRYGGCFAVAMAYCGTSNNTAVGRLLHVAVSDVNKDVRRAAVMSLGFVMFRDNDKVPRLVSLLSISYCPHARYGACLAVGIACAGTALPAALELLEPMMTDKVDFVRQGAFIAMAMVLIEESPAACKQLKPFIKKLNSVIQDKHQPTMAKMGAILALGILNAGGRNVTIALASNAGFKRMAAVVGLLLSLQYWYWYPLMHFMSLSFAPTALIGLDTEMRMPVAFEATCDAKPSLFAYVAPLEEKKEEKKVRITTVELSTTVKARARRKKLDRQKSSMSGAEAGESDAPKADAMEVEGAKPAGDSAEGDATKAAAVEGVETKDADSKAEAKEPEPEPTSFKLANPCRVTRRQRPHVVFKSDIRHSPVVHDAHRALGVVMLRDSTPSEPQEFVQVKLQAIGEDLKEPEPPEDFIWTLPTAGSKDKEKS